MSNSHFAKFPSINIPRTRFKQTFQHKTSFMHGKLVPLDCFEIIPGDEFTCDLSSLIRMSTPIAPIMDNIECFIHAFFVPMRLVYDKTEEFYGANKTGAGYQTGTFAIPQVNLRQSYFLPGSVSDYLGKPMCYREDYVTNPLMVSCLKERAYCLIYNEWYRAQQIQAPVVINTSSSDANKLATKGQDNIMFSEFMPFSVCKKFDYFTSATISPQYGEAVTLPLGTFAPVEITTPSVDFKASAPLASADASVLISDSGTATTSTNLKTSVGGGNTATLRIDWDNVTAVADLSNATAATINQIRYATMLQKYLEKSNFGSRFFEMLQVHYGVTSPDARLQRPEYLGATKFYINVDQILSTAGYQAGTETEVGQPGAYSVTAHKSKLFTKAFVEPGYVMILLETKHDRSYAQGILREDLKTNRFEFYSPEFAALGDQAITAAEIYALATNPTDVFGYQEHWAEYRFRQNRVSGLLNPNASNSLDYWTLAEKFNAEPVLNEDFIIENRDCLSRALTTGATGPDYIGDFYFEYTSTRELPLYSLPGLSNGVI